MITLVDSKEGITSVVVCDICSAVIDRGRGGVALGLIGKNSPTLHACKGECHDAAEKAVHGHGGHGGFFELYSHLAQLQRNCPKND